MQNVTQADTTDVGVADRAPDRVAAPYPGGPAQKRVAVSGAAIKGAYNTGLEIGKLGRGPEANPWWERTDEVGRRYAASCESGRQMGRRMLEQTKLDLG
jgi:hypothetical protein